MIMGQLKPTQVLNKAYRQIAVETTDFEHFKSPEILYVTFCFDRIFVQTLVHQR